MRRRVGVYVRVYMRACVCVYVRVYVNVCVCVCEGCDAQGLGGASGDVTQSYLQGCAY